MFKTVNMWSNIKHFKPSEFDSRDLPGSGVNMQPEFMSKLDRAREVANIPFKINSGYRTAAHNAKVGKPDSAHTRGWAADIMAKDSESRYAILSSLFAAGFARIGIYKTFIHVDCDPSLPSSVVWA